MLSKKEKENFAFVILGKFVKSFVGPPRASAERPRSLLGPRAICPFFSLYECSANLFENVEGNTQISNNAIGFKKKT